MAFLLRGSAHTSREPYSMGAPSQNSLNDGSIQVSQNPLKPLEFGSTGQMPAQETGVNLAAEARVVRRFAGEDSRAAQAEEALGLEGGLALQDGAQRITQARVAGKGAEQPPKMVAEDPFFT